MKMIRNSAVALAALMAAPVVSADGFVQLGVGLGEFSNGGASNFSTHYSLRAEYGLTENLALGLRHVSDDFDDNGLEIDYTTLMGAWAFHNSDSSAARVGLVLERQEGEQAGASASDDAIGLVVGGSKQLGAGIELAIDLAYLNSQDDEEDIFDASLRVNFDLTDQVIVGVDYWSRNTSADNTADADQDALSVTLGYAF